MLHIVPADVLALLAEQSLAAMQGLSPAPRAHVPVTTSGMTPFGAILDTTRFSLTAQGLEALAEGSRPAPITTGPAPVVCPECGGALLRDYEPGLRAAWLVCENGWNPASFCTFQQQEASR